MPKLRYLLEKPHSSQTLICPKGGPIYLWCICFIEFYMQQTNIKNIETRAVWNLENPHSSLTLICPKRGTFTCNVFMFHWILRVADKYIKYRNSSCMIICWNIPFPHRLKLSPSPKKNWFLQNYWTDLADNWQR